MSVVKVYFDKYGRIKNVVRPPIFATSKKVDTIEAYADFDTTDKVVSIALKRADGVVLGSFPMVLESDSDNDYHKYLLDEDDTKIPGALQITIRYEVLQEDPITNDLVLVQSKATSMFEIYIYETVDDAVDKLGLLLKQINELKERVKDLEQGLNLEGVKITFSKDEPEIIDENHYWFKIL